MPSLDRPSLLPSRSHSTGRCNSFREYICRRPIAECLGGSCVELARNPIQLRLGVADSQTHRHNPDRCDGGLVDLPRNDRHPVGSHGLSLPCRCRTGDRKLAQQLCQTVSDRSTRSDRLFPRRFITVSTLAPPRESERCGQIRGSWVLVGTVDVRSGTRIDAWQTTTPAGSSALAA